jgi:hypothetical protein
VRREHRGGLLRYSYREAASGSALFFPVRERTVY